MKKQITFTRPKKNFKVKEIDVKKRCFWNSFEVMSEDMAMSISIKIEGKMLILSVETVEYLSGKIISINKKLKCPDGVDLGNNGDKRGILKFEGEDYRLSFDTRQNTRHVKLYGKDDEFGICKVDVMFMDLKNPTVFTKSDKAIYEHKFLMQISGFARFGDSEFNFSTEKDIGLFDWGRTEKQTFIDKKIIKANTKSDDNSIAFIIQEDMDDRAEKNYIVYNETMYEIGELSIGFNEKNIMKPWMVESIDRKLVFEFVPKLVSEVDLKSIFYTGKSFTIYGRITGSVDLKDGMGVSIFQNALCKVVWERERPRFLKKK